MRRVKGEKCKLSDLKIGQLCRIIEINIANEESKIHLLEMGLINNTKVKIKKYAPFGNPVCIELRGYEMFIEKQVLKDIFVEVI